LVLGQRQVADKSNEITAVPELLRSLELAGCIVTLDAIERKEPAWDYWETVEKWHGRIETRRYWQSDRIGWFAGKEAWEALRSVGVVEAVREIDGKISMERRYSLSSLPLDTQRFGKAVRSHWGVEDQLHWVREAVFNEDQSRARNKNAGENLATLRRWSLNLIKADKLRAKRSLKGRRKCAGWDNACLLHLFGIH
jgi:predicted transposase YbfD/YdcC